MSNFLVGPLLRATCETVYMVFIASFLSIAIGLVFGSFLFITSKKQALENTWAQRMLGMIVNVTRSIPFIILMISVIPFTRLLVGTTIGTDAAIVPLTIAAIPFFARICESALAEVPYGLVEAANAMGASTWQMITKILIPESLPALIRGATLTVIGLIGYSAMAGVVGGGGLGELAINYGYQRFDVRVMLETVIILIILVQLIQIAGDYLAKNRIIKPALMLSTGLALFFALYHLWPYSAQQEATLRVGVMSGAQEQILKIAAKTARDQFGLHLKIVAFNDYVQPNTALANESIDVNIFQHIPYLDGQIKAHHYALSPIAKTFVYPMGFYSQSIRAIQDIKEGARVAIPNDPSNGGRALLVLAKAGLIALKPDVGAYATVTDITENKRHLQFKLLDAAQLPRVLKDVDLVAITNDFVGPAGLSIKQALIKEGSDSPYANIIVVRDQDKNKTIFNELVAVMHSPAVVDAVNKAFPDGAAIAAWQ